MKFENFKGLTFNLEVPKLSYPFYLLFISHNWTVAKLSSFYAGFKIGIHLNPSPAVNLISRMRTMYIRAVNVISRLCTQISYISIRHVLSFAVGSQSLFRNMYTNMHTQVPYILVPKYITSAHVIKVVCTCTMLYIMQSGDE